jgi:O-Antigen ligase
MTHEGHRLAVVLVAIALASASMAIVVARLEPRCALAARTRRLVEVGLAAGAAIAVVMLLASLGSPTRLAQRAWDGFSNGGPAESANLNNRLLHISGSGRTILWSVAWRDAKAHPLLGSGGGTFEQVWNRERPVPSDVRNAHNLYLETLAELGPLGLALLVTALALPLVAAVRGRDRPLAFAAFGAYVAFVLHIAVDWDWQIASVTLAALLCGAALLASPGQPLGLAARRVALWGAIALAAVGVYTLASQIPMSHLRSATAHNDWSAAERDANHAAELAPWSDEPWVSLGESDLNAGRLPQARVALRKAIAKNPSDWATWLDLGRATTGAERANALARSHALNPLAPGI